MYSLLCRNFFYYTINFLSYKGVHHFFIFFCMSDLEGGDPKELTQVARGKPTKLEEWHTHGSIPEQTTKSGIPMGQSSSKSSDNQGCQPSSPSLSSKMALSIPLCPVIIGACHGASHHKKWESTLTKAFLYIQGSMCGWFGWIIKSAPLYSPTLCLSPMVRNWCT